eukprot:COSAG01_NODE_31433_length_597_cov_8.449799_1_plen_95_part_01
MHTLWCRQIHKIIAGALPTMCGWFRDEYLVFGWRKHVRAMHEWSIRDRLDQIMFKVPSRVSHRHSEAGRCNAVYSMCAGAIYRFIAAGLPGLSGW